MTSSKNTEPTPEIITLWPEGAPGTKDWEYPEQENLLPPDLRVIRNVSQPTLTAYLPPDSIANGTAIIVCPGGAFHFLSIDLEGTRVAHWLNQRGIAAFVLKYRLIQTGDNFPAVVWESIQDQEKMLQLIETVRPMITADGQQAVRLVRQQAAGWGLEPDRIGMMGFSAGANVTANVALQHDASSRPDFAGVIYSAPVKELPVPPDAPPLFLLCAADDDMASAASLSLYSNWKNAGKPVELHIYAQGGHGFGMNTQNLPSDSWIERFVDWIKSLH